MTSVYIQKPTANTIGGRRLEVVITVAKGPDLVLGEIFDLSAVLLVLCVAIKKNASNSLLDRVGERFDSSVCDCGTLTISTASDDCVGAFGGSEIVQPLRIRDPSGVTSFRRQVSSNSGSVGDTFDSNIGDLSPYIRHKLTTNDGTLIQKVSGMRMLIMIISVFHLLGWLPLWFLVPK
jgi:hypothetical protein